MKNQRLVLLGLVVAVLVLATFACGQPFEFDHYDLWVQGIPAD